MAVKGNGKGDSKASTGASGGASTELVIPELTPEDYRNLQTWDDVAALIADKFQGEFVDADKDLGDGFVVLKDKDKLVDAPMWILTWDFHKSELGAAGEFVAARVVANTTRGLRKYIMVDGSTGIYKQLRDHSNLNPTSRAPIKVNYGLRRSDYTVMLPDPNNPGEEKPTPATTYYINTSGEE